MVDAYTSLKFVHILLAILAVGSNLSYGIWIGRASRSPQVLPSVLRTVKFLDNFVANPSYVLLLVTGGAMVWLGGLSWVTPWILGALVLWTIVALLGLGLYTPSLRKQIHALDRFGFQSQQYRESARHSTIIGILTGVPVVAILVLMVFKPGA